MVQRLRSSDVAKTHKFTTGFDWLLPSPTSTKRTRASVNICRANKIGQLCISASCKYAAPAADLRPLEDPLPGKSARQGLQIWTENILYSHASCLAKIFTGLAWFENLNGFEHLHGSFTSRGCSHKVARPKAAFAKHVHWILWLQRSMDPWTYELFLHPFLSSMFHFLPLFLGIGRFQRVSLCLGSLWKIYVNNPRIHGCYNPSIQPSSHPAIRSSGACTGECTESSCLHIRSEWRVAATHSWHVASTKIYWYTLLRSPSTSPLHHDTPASQLQ